jgi:hypothetical protein
MANPTSVREALVNAPIGTQWFAVTSRGTFNLRKTGTGQFVFFVSGQQQYPANLQDAISFYNANGLDQANRPEWVPIVPPRPQPQRTVPAPAPAPAPAPIEVEEPEEEPEEEPNEILVMGDRYMDWRVRLMLAPESKYLYNAVDAGILTPLKQTGGVIFPYTPLINIIYTANYEASSIVHTNYKVHQYSNSAVDSVTITCDFTAQDTREAIYLLAVIHFFRSVTKMFYGQDQNPRAGTPPPLCYIKGMGSYQFAQHPLAITNFTYNLPQDVDYIEVSGPALAGLTLPANPVSNLRLPPGVLPGGGPTPPKFVTESSVDQLLPVTRVPTKMQIQLSAIPIISRGDMASEFSLEGYAAGDKYTRGQFW